MESILINILARAYLPSIDAVAHDLMVAIPLSAWVFIVVHYISRWCYEWASKRWGEGVGLYFARKIIHMAAGGFVALLVPFFFVEPWVPFALGVLFAVYTYIPHRTGKLFYWFQDPENISEVYYCLSWAIAVLIAWPFNVWLAVYPLFLMSFGDGVTGIIRGIRQRRRVKSWDGTIGFILVSLPIGYLLFGWVGVLVALVAGLMEKWGAIDDNIGVPFASLAMLLIAYFYGFVSPPTATVF